MSLFLGVADVLINILITMLECQGPTEEVITFSSFNQLTMCICHHVLNKGQTCPSIHGHKLCWNR